MKELHCWLLFSVLVLAIRANLAVHPSTMIKTRIPSVPPTNGVLPLNFIFTGNISSADDTLSINIVKNVGTFTLRGETFKAVAYYTQVMGWPNPPGIVRWIDLVGVSTTSDNLGVVYIGLYPTDYTQVMSLWEEDYKNILTPFSPYSFTVSFTDLSNQPNYNTPVHLPALTGVPASGLDTQYTIKGDQVALASDKGWMVANKGINYTIVPISVVDCDGCGANCNTCKRSPWFELHFIYYNAQVSQTGFGIFYIYPYDKTFVQLNYTFTLPTVSTPAITYKAIWTPPPAAGSSLLSRGVVMLPSSSSMVIDIEGANKKKQQ